MLTIAVLLQTQAPGRSWASLLPLLAMFAIFYFLFFVPQRREQKRHRELLDSLRPGMEVITAGGIVGEIIGIKENLVTLKSGDSRLVVERSRILKLSTPPTPAK